MSNKRKDRSKKKKADVNIFSKGWKQSQGSVDLNVVNKLRALSNSNDFHNITKIAQNRNLSKMFVPVFDERNAHNIYNLSSYLSPRAYFYWLLGLLRSHASIIKKFLVLRESFNAALLNSDADQALSCINELDGLTFSWWAVENRLHIMKELQKVDTKQFVEDIRARFPKSGVAYLISILSESNSIDIFLGLFEEQIKEYRSSGLADVISYSAVLSSKFLPLSSDKNRDLKFDNLVSFNVESLVDQYLLLQAIVCDRSAKGGALDEFGFRQILEIANLVEDQALINILSPFESIDSFVGEILDRYTIGKYRGVVRDISENISYRTFGLLEIYARSKIYSGENGVESFFDDIANSLIRILTLQNTCNEDISYLQKICTKFRNENWSKSLHFHLTNTLDLFIDPEGVEISRLQTGVLGVFNTPKASNKNYQDLTSFSRSAELVPVERIIRYDLYSLSEPELDRNIFPILADFLQTQASLFIIKQLSLSAIDFAVHEYLENKHAFLHLPMKTLCELAVSLERTDVGAYLSCIIILDIYGREQIGTFEDDKSAIFEEFLELHNTHRPSELFFSDNLNPKIIYFLKNICTLNQLDNIIYFSSNDEVVHERVLILDLLIHGLTEAEAEVLSIERDKVVEALFADKLRAKIETGKLYVDVQALEARRKHVYKTLFEQAKKIEGGVLLDFIDDDSTQTSADFFQLSNEAGEIPYIVSTNDKMDLVSKIYDQCVKDFALNEDYGLDKYLSAEIRHNVFVGQLRSCFEKLNLITERSDVGYTSNIYWKDKYHFVSSSITSSVDEILAVFSHNLDEILSKTNDQFRVSFKVDDECIFNFAPFYERVQPLSLMLNSQDDFELFFKDLIEYMWGLAGEFAKVAQSVINDDLTESILKEIDNLESGILRVKGDVAMVNLMDEIKTARSNFSKDIELVLNWFRFVGSNDSQSYERLGVVIEATVSAFESIYGRKDLDLIFIQDRSDLVLNYREARSLFIALFTGLENASTYRSPYSSISLEHSIDGELDLIAINNSVDSRYSQTDPENFVHQQKLKWTDKKLKLSRAEGGSGLFKMNNFLTNSSAGFEFDISINSDVFTASVSLHHEYFTNRR